MGEKKPKKKLKLDLKVLRTLTEEETRNAVGGMMSGTGGEYTITASSSGRCICPTSPPPASWPCTIPV